MASLTRVACDEEDDGDSNEGDGDEGGGRAMATRAMAMATATSMATMWGDGDGDEAGGWRRMYGRGQFLRVKHSNMCHIHWISSKRSMKKKRDNSRLMVAVHVTHPLDGL